MAFRTMDGTRPRGSQSPASAARDAMQRLGDSLSMDDEAFLGRCLGYDRDDRTWEQQLGYGDADRLRTLHKQAGGK